MAGNKKGFADYRGNRDVAALARSVTTNREFDVYKLQALIFSVAVALALITAGATNLSSFAVPETLLGILALSQGIFVAGVLVRPPAIEDLDKALTDLRKAEENARLAVAYGVDVDASGNLPQPLIRHRHHARSPKEKAMPRTLCNGTRKWPIGSR